MQFLQFKIFEPYADLVRHGLSTRHGGVSEGYLSSLNLSLLNDENEKVENVKKNYRRFCNTVDVDLEKLLMGYQEHTDRIFRIWMESGRIFAKNEDQQVIKLKNLKFGLENEIADVDGVITNIPGLPIMVRFADCQGVLMFDPVEKVVAAAHSGWRGNVKNIIGKALGLMKTEFDCDARNILVGISASLGPCCAEFTYPEGELPEFMQKYFKGNKIDLWKCSLDQILATGVLGKNIEITGRCTVCENKTFFSYRAGKRKTGHMGAVIELM